MNALLQWGVVGLLLAWSVAAMLARFFPGQSAALREALARRAGARGHGRMAAWLRPAPAEGGCDSGCGSCRTGCATPLAPAGKPVPGPASPRDVAAPVQWRH